MASRLLPFITQSISGATDPNLQNANRYIRATAVLCLDRGQGIAELEELYTRARKSNDHTAARAAAATLASELERSDPHEAQIWLDKANNTNGGGDTDPWSQLLLDLKSAKIARELGHDPDALLRAESLLTRVEELVKVSAPANSRSIRGEILHLVANAAKVAGDHTRSREIEEILRHETADSRAANHDIAQDQFNDAVRDSVRGVPAEQAIETLVAALGEFSNPGDEDKRSRVLRTLAAAQFARGNDDEAIELAHQALRANYKTGRHIDTAVAHNDLAIMMATGRRPELDSEIAAHLLAAAVIRMRISNGLFLFTKQSALSSALGLVSLPARATSVWPADEP